MYYMNRSITLYFNIICIREIMYIFQRKILLCLRTWMWSLITSFNFHHMGIGDLKYQNKGLLARLQLQDLMVQKVCYGMHCLAWPAGLRLRSNAWLTKVEVVEITPLSCPCFMHAYCKKVHSDFVMCIFYRILC